MKILSKVVLAMACLGLVLFIMPGFIDIGHYRLVVSIVGMMLLIGSVALLAVLMGIVVIEPKRHNEWVGVEGQGVDAKSFLNSTRFKPSRIRYDRE